MARLTACGMGDGCVDPIDQKMGDGFCTRHSYAWRRSEEFRQSIRDDGVILAAQLRAPKFLRSALRPFRKRWVKRMQSEGEE